MPLVRQAIIDKLTAELDRARQHAVAPNSRDGGRFASIVALSAVLDCIKELPGIEKERLHYVLANLKYALLDLEEGKNPSMFQVRREGKRGTTAVEAVKAHAAAAMELLMRSGESRDVAAAKVGRELEKRGYRYPGKRTDTKGINAKQVERWRDEAVAGNRHEDLDADLFKHARDLIDANEATVFGEPSAFARQVQVLLDDLSARHPPSYVLPGAEPDPEDSV